jgi:hypothetical protein
MMCNIGEYNFLCWCAGQPGTDCNGVVFLNGLANLRFFSIIGARIRMHINLLPGSQDKEYR